MSNDIMKAFPLLSHWDDETRNGMDLRDYFAAKAMQALLWNPDRALDDKEDVVLAAYEYADEMLKARENHE